MFTRKIFSKNYISEKYFSGIFWGNLFPLVLWPDRGIQGSLGAAGGSLGVLRGKNFYAKNFLQKLHVSEKYFSGIFGKTFSARVVARQGYLGIFGGPWGTLGGTEGKKFYAKNFLKKLYIRKVFFGNFWGQLVSSRVVARQGYLGIFGGCLGEAWGY